MLTGQISFLISSLTLRPLNMTDQSQDSLPVSSGNYTQADQGIMVQVSEVSCQQETPSTEGVQVPAEKYINVFVTTNYKLLTRSSDESSHFHA